MRIVAATNKDLATLVKEGRFREDLFYRINVIRIAMPPLRARPDDIAHIAERFVRQTAARKGKRIDGISPEALALLMRHAFPGNVRELENILEYACLFCPGPVIEVSDLPEWFVECVGPSGRTGISSLQEAEAKALREALAKAGWNRARTAAALGIHKTTLYRKLKRLGLALPVKRGRSRGVGAGGSSSTRTA